MQIAIFGSGYGGLVTGACFAAAGVEVIGTCFPAAGVDPIKLAACNAVSADRRTRPAARPLPHPHAGCGGGGWCPPGCGCWLRRLARRRRLG